MRAQRPGQRKAPGKAGTDRDRDANRNHAPEHTATVHEQVQQRENEQHLRQQRYEV